MKKQHLRLISWLLLLTVFLSACNLEKPPEYSYTEEYLRISEPYGEDFIFNGNVFQVSVNGHTYAFHSSIPEPVSNQFILAQEGLCQLLERNGISTAGQTYRVLENYSNWTDSANQVSYYGLNMLKSWKQVLTTVQAALGDYTNYGYLYALSNKVAADLGWKQDEISKSASGEALSENTRLLNLVYPCFDEKYTDAADIESCKLVAKELLSGLENIWSEEAFLQAQLDYAQSKSLDFQPTYLTFAYYSPSCPLKLQTKYLEVFRDYTFQASGEFLAGYIEQDYMADTGSLIHTFEWFDEQLTQIRGAFASFEMPEGDIVPVRMCAELPRGFLSQHFESGGIYVHVRGERNIYATTVTVLAHEYTHYLYDLCCGGNLTAYEPWHNEAVAYYLSVGSNFEKRWIFASQDKNGYMESIETLIGQAYDEPLDEIRFLRRALREDSDQCLFFLKNISNQQIIASAFGEYFVRTYGKDAYLRCMLDASKTKDITGKTLDEVLDDWIADMQDPSKDEFIGQFA